MASSGPATPFSTFERMLALRYLRARRKEGGLSIVTLLSFIGVVLGVATLIVVLSVFNGFHKELQSKILGFSGHATIYRKDVQPFADYGDLVGKLKQVEGITKAVPFVEGQVLASTAANKTGALVRGIKSEDLAAMTDLQNKDLRTAFLAPPEPDAKPSFGDFEKSGGIAVGDVFARQHRVELGGKVELLSPNGPDTPLGQVPMSRSYPVVAIFKVGMNDYDENVVYMPFEEAKDFFGEEGATSIQVMVKDPDKVQNQQAAMLAAAGPDMTVQTWQARNIAFFNALAVERNVVGMVLSMVIMVAALNIISGLYMMVKDKGSNIGILRTMGATSGSIMRVFFMAGAAIGTIGTGAGLLLGMLICWNAEHIRQGIQWISGVDPFNQELYYLSKLPADVDYWQTALVAFFALAISYLATLYPSWKAARLDPVEALRYE